MNTGGNVASDIAESLLQQRSSSAISGNCIVPLNLQVEPWDLIEVIDTRINQTFEARVAYIQHVYREDEAVTQIYLGVPEIAFDRLSRVLGEYPPLIFGAEEEAALADQVLPRRAFKPDVELIRLESEALADSIPVVLRDVTPEPRYRVSVTPRGIPVPVPLPPNPPSPNHPSRRAYGDPDDTPLPGDTGIDLYGDEGSES